MEPIGYLLLGIFGIMALKVFGAGSKTIPSFPGVHNPIDPKTGAKVINTSGLIPDLTSTPGISGSGPLQPGQTSGAAARIPATDIGGGKFWCPYPFTLYKDQSDGKFYCYNETNPIDTSSATVSPTVPQDFGVPLQSLQNATPDEAAQQIIDATNPVPGSQPPDYVQQPSVNIVGDLPEGIGIPPGAFYV